MTFLSRTASREVTADMIHAAMGVAYQDLPDRPKTWIEHFERTTLKLAAAAGTVYEVEDVAALYFRLEALATLLTAGYLTAWTIRDQDGDLLISPAISVAAAQATLSFSGTIAAFDKDEFSVLLLHASEPEGRS